MAELFICGERDDLGGGRFRHTQHIKPICYADAADAGRLKRIAANWVDSGIIGRPHLVSASKMMVSVANDGMRRIHPTREADRYMEIGTPYVKVAGIWRKVGFVSATRTANSITWHRPQADLKITHAGHYIKLDLELLGGYVPEGNLIAFPVGLSGLTRSGGRILAGAETVALLRAPVVTDADNPDDVRPIAWEFANVGGQPYLVMTLPSLAGMARPVVDPTLTLQPDAAAGFDFSTNASITGTPPSNQRNYGVSSSFAFFSSTPYQKWSLVTLPSGALVSAATMQFTVIETRTGNRMAWAYEVALANQTVIEGTKSNTQAAAGEPNWLGLASDGGAGVTTAWAGGAGSRVAGTDYVDTLLATYNYIANAPIGTQYTISFNAAGITRIQACAGADFWLLWIPDGNGPGSVGSSDHATESYRPKLVVDYTLPLGWYGAGALSKATAGARSGSQTNTGTAVKDIGKPLSGAI